ncbi:MAG: hydroxymethylbilane synthase [Bacteroidota bacterium]
MDQPVRIATRGSELALWQAKHVQRLLEEIGLNSELVIIKTQGDRIQDLSFDKMEGKGFFTKEIEDALLEGRADLAVHSHKDLPTGQPAGLVIAAVSEREDPSELLLIRKEAVDGKSKFHLRPAAVVGTSSARRKAQLLSFRPDVRLEDLRGNVPTRVNKLREGKYDAILIATAGVERLGLDLSDFHVEKLDPREFIPAPAQGVLALQVRSTDVDLKNHVARLNCREVAEVIGIEREVLRLFQGGCQMPVGVFAEYDDDRECYRVRASRAAAWNETPVNVFLESKEASSLPERVIERIKGVRASTVYITREVNEHGHFSVVLSGNGFSVKGWPLIEIRMLPIKNIPSCDWIFFSSKNAVKFFFRQSPDVNGKRFGCVGKATSEALRAAGHRAEFIGSQTDTRLTGKQFAAKVGSGKVLFPQAKGSLRSIQQQFVKKEQVIDLPVYETLKRDTEPVPVADIMVFTSPSNVEAYFEKNVIQPKQTVVAMGDATAAALRQHGIQHAVMTDTFDEAGLARAVFSAAGRKNTN